MSMGNKEVLANNLKYYMDKHNVTRNDLVDDLNIAYMTISDWINAKTYPRIDKIELLAHYFQIEKSDLIEYHGNKTIIDEIIEVSSQLQEIRQQKVYNFAEAQLEEQNKVISIEETQTVYLNSKLSAGTGIIDLDPSDTKEVEYNGRVPKHDLAFKVSGDSMTPTFADGEIVFVEKTPDIYNGQFIAVQINESAFLKKVYIEDDCLRLVSLNKDYDDIVTNGNDDIRVIGRVIL